MLCYRCGGHVKDGAGKCVSCGQRFDPALKAGPAAGFGAGIKKPRHAIEGAPCQPGDLVAGRYQIKDCAGAGPLGWMFRAVEVSTDAPVALKVLSPRFVQTAEEKRTFVDELHKAQRLSHPNIARIYEAGEDGGRPFIAAQYLDGMTLRRIIDLRRQKGQLFTLQEVEPIVAQIAAALDAAFAHGNLKPDNVIVLPDLLKLTDFGLAVSLPRAPFMAAQKAAAVHRYLAPEFLLGEPLDARTDVFSMGVMLAEMLSGAQYEAQLSLLEKNPTLPEAVEALFRRAVSPRPAARYATAGEMAAELSELVALEPRPAPVAPRPAEDAGDVVIVEAYTDPRLRIARALGAARAPDPAETPQPPIAAQPDPAAKAIAPRTQPDPPRAAPEPVKPAPLDAAALAALSTLPLPPAPFTPPPPYEAPALAFTTPYQPPAPFTAPSPAPAPAEKIIEQAPVALAAVSEPPVAPIAEPPSEELREIAASVGATPELLTAETAVRPAPSAPESAAESQADGGRPRRGAGKRKDRHARGRRRSGPPGSPGAEIADPAWTSSAPPTEGALAIGPTTAAFEPIRPEVSHIPTPAKPVRPIAPRASAPPAFGAMEDKRPSRAPLFAAGAVGLTLLVGGAWSVVSSRASQAAEKPAESAAQEAAKAAPAKPPEPARAAEPPKAAEKAQVVVPSRRDGGDNARRSMRDRVRAVKDRVEKALEDRRRQREEALAASKVRRAADKSEKAAAAPAPAAVAAVEPVAQPAKPPPPAGAITGLGEGDLMVSKDRGRTVASAVPAAYVPSAAQREFACPPGMQKVPGGTAAVGSDASDDLRNFGDRALSRVELKPYCIDQYEFPNQPGKLPKVAAPFTEADALCKNAGKRLCSEDEWEAACRGPQNLRFPYGTRFDPDACNTTDAKDNPRQTSVSGAFNRCKSGYDVFDLSGNAAEWTASSFDGASADKAVKGGHAARPGFDDRCASRRKLAPGAHAINVGFRCCADAR